MTGKKQPDKEKRWCLVTWNTTGDIHRKLINSSAENYNTWTDPLYESVFSGPKAEAGQHVKTKQLHRLFNDEKYDTFLYIGMKAYIIFLLAAVWIFGMRYLKEYDKAALGLIFLIGGFFVPSVLGDKRPVCISIYFYADTGGSLCGHTIL